MLNRIIGGIVVASCTSFALVVGVDAQASAYRITVALDETTRGDFDVVGTSLEGSPTGSEVSRAVRRLASSTAAELAMLANQRVSAGSLKLDDGSLVTLGPEDEIFVSVAGEPEVEYVAADGSLNKASRKSVVIVQGTCNAGHCSMKPTTVIVIAGGQCRRAVLFSHPPTLLSC
jgi:hypothetical protein